MKLAIFALSVEAVDGQVTISQEQRETGKLSTITITAEQVDYLCDLLRRVAQPAPPTKDDKPLMMDDKDMIASDKPPLEWAEK